MGDIVEHVAISTFHAECEPHMAETGYGTRFAWDDAMPQVQERHNAIARAAIRATLEYLRENHSNEMLAAGWGQLRRAHLPKLGPGPGLPEAFRAMISAALNDIERTG